MFRNFFSAANILSSKLCDFVDDDDGLHKYGQQTHWAVAVLQKRKELIDGPGEDALAPEAYGEQARVNAIVLILPWDRAVAGFANIPSSS